MKKSYLNLILLSFILTNCMETPEVANSQESLTRKKILQNQTEAKEAQKEYLKLQQQRK